MRREIKKEGQSLIGGGQGGRKIVSFILFMFACFLSFAVFAQEDNDYEELVQRNLELRQKLKILEEKYTAIENERNVLIIHIRNLQEEKDRLIRLSGGARAGEASGDELKAAFGEVSRELGLVAKERDQLRKESTRLKEAQLKSEAAIKGLEEEKTKLDEEIRQIQSTFAVNQKESAAAFGGLENEKASLADQMIRLKKSLEEEKAALLVQQEEAVAQAKALAMVESQEAAKALENEKIKFEKEKKNLQEDKERAVEEAQKKNRAAIKTLTEDKAKLAEEILSLKKAFDVEKNDLLNHQREAVEKTRKENAAAMKSLEEEKDLLTAGKANLEKELKEMEESFGKEREGLLSRYEEAMKKADREKTALGAQLEQREEENKKSLEEQERVFKEIQSEDQITIKTLEEKAQDLAKQLAMEEALYQTKGEEWESGYQALVSEQETLKANSLVLTENNKAFIKKSEGWEQEKKTLEEKIRQGQEESKSLLADLRGKRESWRKEIKAALVERKQLRRKVDQLDKAERLTKEESDRLKIELKAFQGRIRELEDGLKAGHLARKEYESLIQKLTTENSGLREQLVKRPPARGGGHPFSREKRPLASQEDRQRLNMHFNLAVTYDKTGMYAQEEQEYLECLKIDPEDAYVHYNLAILYDDRLNDHAKALRHYRKYLSLKPVGEDAEKIRQWMLYAEEEARLSGQTH